MEREQFKVLVKAMKAVYAQPTFIPDQDAFNVWFALLGDLPYKQAELAVQKHMATEKFPPTIADIREKAEQITSVKETEMSELEAWAIVRKAIGRSNYYAEEEFEKLPEACKMAVGNPSNLREWAMMDSDQVGTVEQSHFVRNYRTAMQRIKEDRRMPEKVRTAIAEVKKQQMQIEDRQEKWCCTCEYYIPVDPNLPGFVVAYPECEKGRDPMQSCEEYRRKGYAIRNSSWADRIRERFMRKE